MGKSVALDRAHLEWARRQFAEYYRSNRVPAPTRGPRREFAWFPFAEGTLMRRHLAIPSPDGVPNFLAEHVPRHVYYSAAYYRDPSHPKMDGKGWIGADLIFDLDADHLKGAQGLDYAAQLRRVKERLRLLLDEYVFGDFGVDPRECRIVFSGGRGYHVHVFDERFLPLTSPERRELVEYVQGIGFDPSAAVLESRTSDPGAAGALPLDGELGPGSRRRRPARAFRALVPLDTPGWSGRTSRALVADLERWEEEGSDTAAKELEQRGVAADEAQRLARTLVDKERGRRIRETLSLDVFPGEVPRPLLEAGVRGAAVEVQGETDAPVTTDIHRLIRLPGSLHGGTGFRVIPLTSDGLDDFSPLRDAHLPDPAGRSVPIRFSESVDYPFDPPARGRIGEEAEVAPSVALFLILRGEAELRTSP